MPEVFSVPPRLGNFGKDSKPGRFELAQVEDYFWEWIGMIGRIIVGKEVGQKRGRSRFSR